MDGFNQMQNGLQGINLQQLLSSNGFQNTIPMNSQNMSGISQQMQQQYPVQNGVKPKKKSPSALQKRVKQSLRCVTGDDPFKLHFLSLLIQLGPEATKDMLIKTDQIKGSPIVAGL